MAFVNVNMRLRPLRLAYLVDPADKGAILRAIQVNTFLWGGAFNPIIPLFKRVPKAWRGDSSLVSSPKEIIAGYLDAYDPDYVVFDGSGSKLDVEVGNRQRITSSDIMAGVEEDGTPKFGIGLFEILSHLLEKEMKFVRRDPLEFLIPNLGESHHLFLASVFGCLPDPLLSTVMEEFAPSVNLRRVTAKISGYSELLKAKTLFLRRISSLYIEPLQRQGRGRGECIFLLDAANALDIIDYWNLRAVGWNVLPVAKQYSESEGIGRLAAEFIQRNFFPDRFNPKIFHRATLLRSRTISPNQLEHFANSLKTKSFPDGGEEKFVLQNWYPRIWDEWARDSDGVQCYQVNSRSASQDVLGYQDRIRFKVLDPEFMRRFGGHGEPRFANEINLRISSEEEPFSEVIPEAEESLARAIGSVGLEHWRFSRTGMVCLSRHSEWSLEISLPKAEDVFSEWLRSKGWAVTLSPSGRISKQMIKQLGGSWGIGTLANEGVLNLLKRVTEDKVISHEAMWGEVSRIANQGKYKGDQDWIFRRLMDVQMFRLGVQIQCPICQLQSWYSIEVLRYQLQCPKCLETFPIPSHAPKEIKWSYRTFGPFNLPHQGFGVYSVLLTLRFFSQLLDGASTPLMSFIGTKGGKEIEVDLGLLYQESKIRSSKTELIFAECKTYNTFDHRDTERVSFLADQFPGAFLVFSTLRKSLTVKEKRLLRPVVNRGRKYWRAERPFNPVLILTGTELFARSGPPHCWKEAGGTHGAFAKKVHSWINLLELCDATQQLYLGMNPWHEWLRERWEKKAKRSELPSKDQGSSSDSI
jgi:hypothetical protein